MTDYRCTKTEGALCGHEACRPLKHMAADPLPQYQANLRFGPAAGPHLDWAPPYEIAVHGPAAFVAHVVEAAAGGFEEDAQR